MSVSVSEGKGCMIYIQLGGRNTGRAYPSGERSGISGSDCYDFVVVDSY